MSSKSVSVNLETFESNQENERLITLPTDMYIKIGKKISKLKIGMIEENINCNSNNSKDTLQLSGKFAELLGLTSGMKVNLLVKNDKISLGPVIAIFVSNGTISKAIAQNPSFRLIEMRRANADANAIIYYFSIKDVDFIHHRINGTYYDEKIQKWTKKFFPFPEVLYDRGGGALKSQKAVSKYIRKQLYLYDDLKKVNSRYYFDKWDVHEQLIKHKDMIQYLPFTMLYKEPEDLMDIFEKSSTIYIKACFGSNGRGVARVIKSGDRDYKLSYFHNAVVEYELRSLGGLVDKIKEIFEKKKIIIQTAIDVIVLNDRHIDMRATVQRNGNGDLGIYAYPVRLGQEKCPITSTKSGSTVYTFDNFFTNNYGYTKKQIEDLKIKINEMLIKSFKYVEEAYGSFGELGIDFAIDKNFNIWFIECNAKPGKDAMYLSYDKDTIKRAFQNPLEYAKYVTGF